MIGFVDGLAHRLHRAHLIPRRLLDVVCDRHDRRLGVDENEMHRTAYDWVDDAELGTEETLAAFAELDTTEDEFDTMTATGEPVEWVDRPIGYRCDHVTMTTSGLVASAVTGPCWHGCTLQPYYLTSS